MSYLGTEKLRELIRDKNRGVITPQPDEATIMSRVKDAAFELSLGDEAFRTDAKDKKKEFLKDKEEFRINPGQFALLLSKESIHVPKENIAFISIKAKIKLKGLINVSGFHVDPGFNGNLIFSVYNAGTTPISIQKGEPCFLIWFAHLDLNQGEDLTYNGAHQGQNSILPTYIDALAAGELASPNVLLEKINDNYKTLDGKATTWDYLIKAGIGIIFVLFVKFIVDWGMYSKGFTEGYQRKKYEATHDSLIKTLALDQSRLEYKFDSLQKSITHTDLQSDTIPTRLSIDNK